MSFRDLVTEDRRLCFLRLLGEDKDYSLNKYVLQSGLKMLGHGVSMDTVRTDGAWLAEQGLVNVSDVGTGMQVFTLTARGSDVASGVAECPGVQRPRPGE